MSDSMDQYIDNLMDRAGVRPVIVGPGEISHPNGPLRPVDPKDDPALQPQTRRNLVRLANAYQKGGRKALAEKFDEIHPPAADEQG